MKKETNNTGLGLSGVLTLIFVVLKLVGVIDWSWWWVLSPILIDIGLTILVIAGIFIFAIIENRECKSYEPTKKGRRNGWKF